MQSLSQIRELLASHSLAPRHALGQNFLIDHNLIKKFVDAASVTPTDTILEVGPGTGTLTEELLARGATVIDNLVAPQAIQVLLKVRFAEINRTALRAWSTHFETLNPHKLSDKGDWSGTVDPTVANTITFLLNSGNSWLDQATLAEFLRTGCYRVSPPLPRQLRGRGDDHCGAVGVSHFVCAPSNRQPRHCSFAYRRPDQTLRDEG